MRRFVVALSIVAAGALVATGCGSQGTDNLEVFEAVLLGSNEVPPRATAAHGQAGFTFDGTTVNYSVELDDASGIAVGHIHAVPGAAGVNGPVRVFLYPAPPAPTTGAPLISTTDKRVVAQGSFDASNMVGGFSFTQLLTEMRAGTAYVNFHSGTFPAGEVRGQIRPVSVSN